MPSILQRRRILASGSPVWTPGQLSPLIWFNAATLAVANGNPVDTWTNDGTAGAAGNASAIGTARPTMDSTGINGAPAVLFDAVDDAMSFSHASTTAFTVWFIYKANNASGRSRVYSDLSNQLVGFYDGNRSMFTARSFLTGAASATGTHCFIAQCSASGRSLRVNGDTVSDATAAGTLSGLAGLGDVSGFIKGCIGELGVMNRVLTAGELNSLTQYLTVKSGVAA